MGQSLERRRVIAASRLSLFTASVLIASVGQAGERRASAGDETRKTKEAVVALDDRWDRAEANGDVAFLDRLLLPEARSVNADGIARSKAEILARAAKNRGSDRAVRELDAYLRTHPFGTSVVMDGDVAVVAFYVPALGAQKGVKLTDVFLYRDGRWRAAYRQLTERVND